MTYNIPADLLYTADHEWLRRDPDQPDEVTIGITDFAQEQVGDVVYIELPPPGTALTAAEPFGEIESAKTVAELYAPVSGQLIALNDALEEQPELVNESPYNAGWLVRIRLADAAQLDNLLAPDAYLQLLPEDEP